jgi:hypothetical protein
MSWMPQSAALTRGSNEIDASLDQDAPSTAQARSYCRPSPVELAKSASNRVKAEALQAAIRSAPHLESLATAVISRLPSRPRASQNIRSEFEHRSSANFALDVAITLPWMAWDSRTHRNVLVIDIDHDEAMDRWAALPVEIRPHLVVDALSGRAHAIAVLRDPVLLRTHEEIAAEDDARRPWPTKHARIKPQRYADFAGWLLAAALEGNLLPAGSMVKNPWGRTENREGGRRWEALKDSPALPDWLAFNDSVDLEWSTLRGAVEISLHNLIECLFERFGPALKAKAMRTYASQVRSRTQPSWRSKNDYVFDLTRFDAYASGTSSFQTIRAYATDNNATLTSPLRPSAVTSIARSIAKFMQTRYRLGTGSGRRRGRDQAVGVHLDTAGRQALAGHRSADARAAATDTAILAAITALKESGSPIIQTAVAAASGRSLRTIKGRWAWIKQVQDAVPSGNRAGSGCPAAAYVGVVSGDRPLHAVDFGGRRQPGGGHLEIKSPQLPRVEQGVEPGAVDEPTATVGIDGGRAGPFEHQRVDGGQRERRVLRDAGDKGLHVGQQLRVQRGGGLQVAHQAIAAQFVQRGNRGRRGDGDIGPRVGRAVGEPDVGDLPRGSIRQRVGRNQPDVVAVDAGGGGDRGQADGDDAELRQRQQFAGMNDAILLGVDPDVQLAEGGIVGVDHAVAVAVQRTQGGKAVREGAGLGIGIRGSPSCPCAGSSSGRSLSSTAAAVSPRTGNASPARRSLSSDWRPSD